MISSLISSDIQSNDRFGFQVDISGNTIVVSSIDEGDEAGAVYSFRRTGGSWPQHQKLIANDGEPSDRFGISLAVLGDTLVVGANRDDDDGSNSGMLFQFPISMLLDIIFR